MYWCIIYATIYASLCNVEDIILARNKFNGIHRNINEVIEREKKFEKKMSESSTRKRPAPTGGEGGDGLTGGDDLKSELIDQLQVCQKDKRKCGIRPSAEAHEDTRGRCCESWRSNK